MNWSFYEALDRLPIGVAVTIEFVGPLGGRDRRFAAAARRGVGRCWPAAGWCCWRCAATSTTSARSACVLALVAGACWAGYILVSKRVGSTFAQLDGLAIALCIGTLVVLPAGIVQGGSALLRPSVLAGGVGGGDAVVDHPVLARAGRAAPAARGHVRAADEPRAGRGRAGRRARARPGAARGHARRDRDGGDRQRGHDARVAYQQHELEVAAGPQ